MIEEPAYSTPLLTIAIPTFNRAEYLDLCLTQICKQVSPLDRSIEVMVSDNCSTDHTPDVVKKHGEKHPLIVSIHNQTNIGSDRNIIQCFKSAAGKYVLIFGDDDVFLDGGIAKLLKVLKYKEFGVVYLRHYGFDDDFINERPAAVSNPSVLIYNDSKSFVEKVHYFFTFISANVINKTFFDHSFNLDAVLNTSFTQFGWTLNVVSRHTTHAYIDDYIFAAKNNKEISYNFSDTFGKNMNHALTIMESHGMPARFIPIINNHLIVDFIPGFIYCVRTGKLKPPRREDFISSFKIFNKKAAYWILCVPIFYLPLKGAWFWLRSWQRIIRLWRAIRPQNDRGIKTAMETL
jgi:abequosyltransferase